MPGPRKPVLPTVEICPYCHIYASKGCPVCCGSGWVLRASPAHQMVYQWQCKVGLGDSKHGALEGMDVDISDLLESDHAVAMKG